MPSERVTVLSSYLKILRKRSLSSLILELKVLDLFWYYRVLDIDMGWFFFLSLHVLFLYTGIYGGFLLGVRSVNGLAFYDWENTELIRRIEIQPKHVRRFILSLVWFMLFSLSLFCKFTQKNPHSSMVIFWYVFRSSGQTLANWSALLQRSPSLSCVIWRIKWLPHRRTTKE